MDAQQAINVKYLLERFADGSFGDQLRNIASHFSVDIDLNTSAGDVGDALIEECTEKLISIMQLDNDERSIARIKFAIEFAKIAHQDTHRDEGIPFVLHPLRVALILAGEANVLNPDTICAAILHDVLEDTAVSFEDIVHHFGDRVARCVKALSCSDDDSVQTVLIRAEQAQEFGADLIRIADRIDNIRSIVSKRDLGKRLDKIEESEQYYQDFARWKSPRLSAALHSAIEGAKSRIKRDELYEDEVRTRLKSFFFDAHDRITELPIFKRVTTRDISLDNYAEYLKIGYAIFNALEDTVRNSSFLEEFSELWRDDDNRAALLQNDLEAIGVPARQRLVPEPFPAPGGEKLSDFLAALYILRGAQLGGVTIRGKVEHELGLSIHNGTSFLNSSGDGKRTFNKFENYLEVVKDLVEQGRITLDELGKSLGRIFGEIERYSS